ncbi:GNAT family N-acetyltransferase [Shewanella sp. OMA3-2]|uniref:GNAT family N-acetyltransferase n=1 Tax=Shewanella sp. OMA3-2 TaxID=2908650 RepID=UPI001F225CC9|nr:GNAT family N-acetyltransferase [Shewanella sp. OMA3-2]UJF21357.1 GNAT family N-acetyltransferase [Shewanella sp. OMA3-2]
MTQLQVVSFLPRHAADISHIYHQSVQAISHPRYNQAKKDAWSTAPRSAKYWLQQYKHSKAWVIEGALKNVLGFIGLETAFPSKGYIDCLYVHPSCQHQGLASQLIQHVQQWAAAQHYAQLRVDASYLSKPLFEKNGFVLIESNLRVKKGQTLATFTLIKAL